MSNKMYDGITGRSPIATDDLGYIGTGQKASQIMSNGTTDYNDLSNKPTINNVELSGNKTSSDLGLQSALTETQTAAVNSGVTSETVSQVSTNTTNISSVQTHYICDNDRKLYISATEPTGDIPTGSTWIDGKTVKVLSITNIWTENIEQGSWGSESLYKVTSDTRCRTDSAVSVVSGKSYSLNLTGAQEDMQLLIQYRNASDVTISESGWKSVPYSTTIPENATQITLLFRKSDNSNVAPSDVGTLSILIKEWA